MKNKLKNSGALVAGVGLLASGLFASGLAAFALPASAQTLLGDGIAASATISAAATTGIVNASGTVGVSATLTAREKNIVTRADDEITRRMNALNALDTRVNAMVRLSADEKSSLAATIQSQLTAMTTLETQVATDETNATNLKIDVASITKTYRIFALIIPQGAIEAAADRIYTIAANMTTLSGVLQTRIAGLPAGTNATSLNASLTDMNTQIANASSSASAAVTETASLQPDNGNATIMASNTAALKDARSKIQAAQADLVKARKDAGSIVKALITLSGASASSTATVVASTTVAASTTTP